MWKILKYIKKHLVYSIPIAMLIGLLVGSNIDVKILKVFITPLTLVMVYPMMVGLNLKKLLIKGGFKVLLVSQIINFLLIPIVGFLIGHFFFENQTFMILGILLIATLPTSGMTISWTGFAKGNVLDAIKMTIIGLLAGALLAPVYIKFLMGKSIEIPSGKMFIQIIWIVVIPLIAGLVTRKNLIKRYGVEHFEKNIKDKFPIISTLGVLGIIFIAMALKANLILSQPLTILYVLLPIGLFYSINFVVTTVIGRLFFSREEAIALVYGTVMRNLSVALAIAITLFEGKGAEAALIISVAYVVQVQSAAWYVKKVDRFFPKKIVYQEALHKV